MSQALWVSGSGSVLECVLAIPTKSQQCQQVGYRFVRIQHRHRAQPITRKRSTDDQCFWMGRQCGLLNHSLMSEKHHSLHFELSLIWLFKKEWWSFHSFTQGQSEKSLQNANFNPKEWKTIRKRVVPDAMALQRVLLHSFAFREHDLCYSLRQWMA